MTVAIIPARGGSKRIARKNIQPFCGKPILAWTIATAIDSKLFSRIIVSTDDEEIAAIARQHGAEIPFMRPEHLSDDHTGTTAVVRHAIATLTAAGENSRYYCCLYATAPFMHADALAEGLQQLIANQADYAFTVTEYPHPIQRALRIDNGCTHMLHPEHSQTRSQDLEVCYHDAAQFYWGTRDAWLQELPVFDSHSVPVILPTHDVQDIDTPDDWLRAESMFAARRTQTRQHAA
ncbi:MAG TPA: pseudaminic acid cytidylyltransferase [Gammaproteobacteria bacterium]|jgi:N-acylneuraminate cytidylyltransferase|nr:pseudaminic acid cytidylyltransferase [Gammaproteobacteria bacterium]